MVIVRRNEDVVNLAAARAVCKGWRHAVNYNFQALQPATLPDAKLLAAFSSLQSLDLSRLRPLATGSSALSTAQAQLAALATLTNKLQQLPATVPQLTAVILNGIWCAER